MVVIQFFLFIVCFDILIIVFRIVNAIRHDFPVKSLLVRLLYATIVAILLIILFVFVTNYSKYEPICICNRIINNK